MTGSWQRRRLIRAVDLPLQEKVDSTTWKQEAAIRWLLATETEQHVITDRHQDRHCLHESRPEYRAERAG